MNNMMGWEYIIHSKQEDKMFLGKQRGKNLLRSLVK